ncbi:hypothetical protein, partial [Pseudomonas syringae]|uniref:hypothetical protein n=1 Tax=Pseudomonas syringae TaxID=317 RepID=UPI001F3CF7F1
MNLLFVQARQLPQPAPCEHLSLFHISQAKRPANQTWIASSSLKKKKQLHSNLTRDALRHPSGNVYRRYLLF